MSDTPKGAGPQPGQAETHEFESSPIFHNYGAQHSAGIGQGMPSETIHPGMSGDPSINPDAAGTEVMRDSQDGNLGMSLQIPDYARGNHESPAGGEPVEGSFRKTSNQLNTTGMPTSADVAADNDLRSQQGRHSYAGKSNDAIAYPDPVTGSRDATESDLARKQPVQ